MNLVSLFRRSSSRLPFDHFLSGAILAGVTTIGYDIAQSDKEKINVKTTAKKALKNSLSAGIATAASIYVANSIVDKNYTQATVGLAIGMSGVLLTEKYIKIQEK